MLENYETQAEGVVETGASQRQADKGTDADNDMVVVISDRSKSMLNEKLELGKAGISCESGNCISGLGSESGSGSGCRSELGTGIGLKLELKLLPSQSLSGCSNWIHASAEQSSASSDTSGSAEDQHEHKYKEEIGNITMNKCTNVIVVEEYNDIGNDNNYNEDIKQQQNVEEEVISDGSAEVISTKSEKDTDSDNDDKDGIAVKGEKPAKNDEEFADNIDNDNVTDKGNDNDYEYDCHSHNEEENINDNDSKEPRSSATYALATNFLVDSVSHKGNAIVYYVSKSIAYAHNCFSEVITCPVLTWSGGNNDNLDAEGLDEVIAVGDLIYVEAYRTRKGNLRAQYWSFTDESKKNECNITSSCGASGSGLCDSFTQTAMTAEQMILRAITPEISEYLRRRIPNILAYAANI